MSEIIRFQLVHAATEFDRKNSTKRGYNPYALGQYLARIEQIMADIEAGTPARAAILAGFSDRIADKCLKAIGEPVSTKAEVQEGLIFYSPVCKQ